MCVSVDTISPLVSTDAVPTSGGSRILARGVAEASECEVWKVASEKNSFSLEIVHSGEFLWCFFLVSKQATLYEDVLLGFRQY